MRHVIWRSGDSGPGVDAVRSAIASHFDKEILKGELILAPKGAIDPVLQQHVAIFQKRFNELLKSKHPAVAKLRKQTGDKLIETGDVDYPTRVALHIDESLAADPAINLPAGVEAYRVPLTLAEGSAAAPGETFSGQAYRLRGLDKLLAAIGLEKGKVGESGHRIAPLAEGRFLVSEKHVLFGAACDKSECAALPQSFGVPDTNQWRRGPRVQDVAVLPVGTIVATLGSGVYLSDYSGQSHVGVFLRKTETHLVMLDQWRGKDGNLGIREKPFGLPRVAKRNNPMTYINSPEYSFRVPVERGGAVVGYTRDNSFERLRYRSNLTGDGSAYHVLMGDGTVARRDIAATTTRSATNREIVAEVVDYLFEDIDVKPSPTSAKALKEALDNLKTSKP